MDYVDEDAPGLRLSRSCGGHLLVLVLVLDLLGHSWITTGFFEDSAPDYRTCTDPSPMKYLPPGAAHSQRIELGEVTDCQNSRPGAAVSLLTPLDPLDPLRQAKRLPIRLIKMLTAHTGHLLHPEYLQPLTSAPVSIEVCHCTFLTSVWTGEERETH